MPAPDGPRQISTMTSPSFTSCFLMAVIASCSVTKTRAGPRMRYTPCRSTTDGSIEVLLTTDASGARLPVLYSSHVSRSLAAPRHGGAPMVFDDGSSWQTDGARWVG